MSLLKKYIILFFIPINLCLYSQNNVIISDARIQQSEDTITDLNENNNLVKEEVPVLLKGIWKNNSRYVVFDTGYVNPETQKNIPQIVLRTFYGWYDDRAGESNEYSQKNKRDKNDSQTEKAQELEIHFESLTDQVFTSEYNKVTEQLDGDILTAVNASSGAWDMQVKYPGYKEIYHIPVAVIGNKLFLDFAIKEDDSDSVPEDAIINGGNIENGNVLNGFWQNYGTTQSFLISPSRSKKELLCYYASGSSIYHLRYWRTDMEYDSQTKAVFSDKDDTYYVPKHIRCAEDTFTCVNGRGIKIRNMEKSSAFPDEYTLNSVNVLKNKVDSNGNKVSYNVHIATICGFGKPFLELCNDKESLEQIINEDNANKKPNPPPLFPPHGVLDFDWSIIENPPKDYNRRMLDLGK